jgi:hypothetical protein
VGRVPSLSGTAAARKIDFGFFVDDSNGQTNDFMHTESDRTLPTTIHKLRHNAQAWSDLLGACGGALELSKCSCHLLHWKFGEHGDPVLVSTRPPRNYPVEVTDSLTQAEHGLTFLSPYTAHKTLGHYMKRPAHNGNSIGVFGRKATRRLILYGNAT